LWFLLVMTSCDDPEGGPAVINDPEPVVEAAIDAAPPSGAEAPLARDGESSRVNPAMDKASSPGCDNPIGICCVAIQPLGPGVSDAMLASVRRGIERTYEVETRVLPPRPLPRSAWYEPRKRWRADTILDELEGLLPDDCDRIAGLTSKDISTTKGKHHDWGILGLGSLGGPSAVISSFRTRKRVKDVPPIQRLERVAIHEVGHTLGLPHCPTQGCYLEDAGGTVETIDGETHLCDLCRARVGMPALAGGAVGAR
jgi:archaemetzincin